MSDFKPTLPVLYIIIDGFSNYYVIHLQTLSEMSCKQHQCTEMHALSSGNYLYPHTGCSRDTVHYLL